MLIAISGTPGTGKTSAAKILAKKIKGKLITTNYLVKKYRIKTSFDQKRKTDIIDVKKLSSAVKKESKESDLIIFEGHLSHFSPANLTIILRTSPAELEERLKKKGWSKKKIAENVEAEAIGIISSEANAIEIDTTRKNPSQVAGLIIKILNKYHIQKRYEKKIDWSNQYEKYLKR